MKISIALCTYNGAKYLFDQLKSIEAQTRKPDELVVCDDKSSDATLDILYSFKGKCKFPVRIYENESNLGSTKNFEKAIRLCSGDIVVLSDQDDVWKNDKIEKIVTVFKEHPDIGYVFSDADIVDEHLSSLGRGLWESVGFQGIIQKQFTGKNQVKFLIEKRNFVTGATLAFLKSFRDIVLPISERWIHDAWIALTLSSFGVYGFPLSERLILYRQHSRQQIGAEVLLSRSPMEKLGPIDRYRRHKQSCCLRIKGLQRSISYLSDFRERITFLGDLYGKDVTYVIRMLDEKIYHLLRREHILSLHGRAKVFAVLQEFLSGRYHKYPEPISNLIADLV